MCLLSVKGLLFVNRQVTKKCPALHRQGRDPAVSGNGAAHSKGFPDFLRINLFLKLIHFWRFLPDQIAQIDNQGRMTENEVRVEQFVVCRNHGAILCLQLLFR